MTQRTGTFRTGMRSTLLNDPYLYHRLLDAAEQAHLSLRDQIIVRMACESGARIHEILCLTVGDWRERGYGREVLSFNKSNRDQHVKLLCFSPQTRELLFRYIDGERKQHDPQHSDLTLLTDTDALFLSGRGRTYGYGAFLLHWKRLCQVAGITFPPSGLRHWFAIQALLQIEERTNNPTNRELVKKVLVQYLGWQSSDAFETDDHILFLKRLEEESMKVHDLNQPVPIVEVCKVTASFEPWRCAWTPPWLKCCYNADENRFNRIPLLLRHHGQGNTKYYVRPPERTFLQNDYTDPIKPDEKREQEEKRDDGV